MHEKDDNLVALPLPELRCLWQTLWGRDAHRYITRPMLERSIRYKQAELRGDGLTPENNQRLQSLVKQYKRDPSSISKAENTLMPGTQLIRVWRGQNHTVKVMDNAFEYDGIRYTSLSQVAAKITGTHWNGWAFFGLRKRSKK